MTTTTAVAIPRTADERLAWEDDHIAAYMLEGHDVDDALTLTAFDWSQLTGESFDEL